MKEFFNYKGGEVRILPPSNNINGNFRYYDRELSDNITKNAICLMKKMTNRLRSLSRKDKITRIYHSHIISYEVSFKWVYPKSTQRAKTIKRIFNI